MKAVQATFRTSLSIIALWAFSYAASAATVSITAENYEGAPPVEGTPTPASVSGNFAQSVTSGMGGVDASPYSGYTGLTSSAFSVLGAGPVTLNSPVGSATYNVNSSSFTFLWGSPDPWNEVTFFSGPDGTGSNLGTFTGTSLECYAEGPCRDTGWDLVTFTASSGDIGSVVLSNADIIAFEFSIPATTVPVTTNPLPVATTPLPGALYLFGGALGGVFWLGRRKRRAVGSLTAA